MTSLNIREAAPSDAQSLGAICHIAFKTIAERHGFPPDFPNSEIAAGLMSHMLSRSDVHGFVAETDGRIVGSNFLWAGGNRVAGVGPITIDPDQQNSGAGRRLMSAVLERAQQLSVPSVRLVQAAYHGRSLALYTQLGFDVREPLSVFQGPVLQLRLEGCHVRAGTAADLPASNELGERMLGHARTSEMEAAVQQGTALVVERDGKITGYTTGVGFLGHTVGESLVDVQALIGASPAFGGPGFLVPTRNAELMRWCLKQGLRIVQPMSLMSYGEYQEPNGAYLPSVLY